MAVHSSDTIVHEVGPNTGRVRVGCSGWDYLHWRGRFYPTDLPRTAWLEAYAREFDTVELNNSFYRLPPTERFAAWRARTPVQFLFAVKASRFLTHVKRLRDPQEPMQRLLEAVRGLGAGLGPLLYQLPPRWIPDPERLDVWLSALPRRLGARRLRHVVEFRDPRGYEPGPMAALRARGVAVCVHDMPGSESPRAAGGCFVYLRFHGHTGRYAGAYPEAALRDCAQWVAHQTRSGRDAYVYFNNDVDGHAPRDAHTFRSYL